MADRQIQQIKKEAKSAVDLLTKAGHYLEGKSFVFGDFGNYYPEGIGYSDDVAITLSRNGCYCTAAVTQLYGDFNEPHLSVIINPEMKDSDWQSILDNFAEIAKHFASAKEIERDCYER